MELTELKSAKIQVLRGLAIIAVVFIHNTPLGMTQVYCRPFLNFSVGLFLFLSGMLSNANNWKPKKRLIKVLVPYIIWTIIYSVLRNIRSPEVIPSFFMIRLITAKAAAVMYYIFIYCEFTLIMPLIDKLLRSKYKYLGFFISPIEIVLMRLIPLITGFEVNKYITVVMSVSCLGWFSYYYLGYALGNHLIQIEFSTQKLICIWAGSIILQMMEGYWEYSMGCSGCSQLKLTAIMSGAFGAMIAYRFIESEWDRNIPVLKVLGDNSFGIFFSHLAVMTVLRALPFYQQVVFYPINAIIVIFIDFICVLVGKRALGKYAKYFAL